MIVLTDQTGRYLNVQINMATGIAKVWLDARPSFAPTFNTEQEARDYQRNYLLPEYPELQAVELSYPQRMGWRTGR